MERNYLTFFEKISIEKGYTTIRVYTKSAFDKAIKLYEKKKC